MQKPELPGTIWLNRRRYNWKVRLPGTDKRKNYKLVPPGGTMALAESKGYSLAESLAWRMWNRAMRDETVRPGTPQSFKLQDIGQKFVVWAETYYRRSDGTQTGEAYNCRLAIADLLAGCGNKNIDDIAYHDILQARQMLIDKGLSRNSINQKRVGIWKRFFAWALENRYCSAHTKSEVWAITNLKKNRSPAKETSDVLPIQHYIVKQTLPFMIPKWQDIIRIIELTGIRRGEIIKLRHEDITAEGDCLVCRPVLHKTAHKGKFRQIVFGPRAAALLRPYLNNRVSEYVFVSDEKKAYSKDRINTVVKRALNRANKAGIDIPHWTPNQLRHACGTRIRRKYGKDAARVVLGHADSGDAVRITDRYTKEAIATEELRVAIKVMRAIG